MNDMQNRPVFRPAIGLTATDTDPMAGTDTPHLWFDGTTVFFVDADGNSTVFGTASNTYKGACRLATAAALPTVVYDSAALTLTKSTNGALTVDGVAAEVGDRILVKDQVDKKQNGWYDVTVKGSGSVKFKLTRAPDGAESSQFVGGALTPVAEGTVNADTVWELSTDAPFVLDTNDVDFVQAPLGVTYGVVGDVTAIDLTAVSAGVSLALARADHQHDLDLSIAPVWTGVHTFGHQKAKVENAGGTFESRLGSLATADRDVNFPDKAGTLSVDDEGTVLRATVTVNNAALKTLNATPVEVVAAPAPGKYVEVVSAQATVVFAGAAFDGVDAGDFLELRYTDAVGAKVTRDVSPVGFADQASTQSRLLPLALGDAAFVTPVTAAALVAHIAAGEWFAAAGGGSLKLDVLYRVRTLAV